MIVLSIVVVALAIVAIVANLQARQLEGDVVRLSELGLERANLIVKIRKDMSEQMDLIIELRKRVDILDGCEGRTE